jgi:prepilin-type N-terminal cleavage/methylation domain-containing protein
MGIPLFWAMRKAFTLPELMLVVALGGILVGIAVPLAARARDSIEVEAAAAHLVAAHYRARIMAVTRNQVVVLSVDSSALRISPPGGGPPLWAEIGPAGSGVALAGPARQFTFSPEGMTLGLSNATLQLARGASSRTVVISRLGRARVIRQ